MQDSSTAPAQGRNRDESALAGSGASERKLAPVSTNTRSRYLVWRKPNGGFGFDLRAHNGGCLLSSDGDSTSMQAVLALIERVRAVVARGNAAAQDAPPCVACRRSLTGKWYFQVCDGAQVLAISRPFDYRSRMDKALYAMRACAPGSRVVVDQGV